MNKKGFTLVELISVITVLGLISLLTIPAVGRIIKDNREKAASVNVDTILNAAYDYAQQCQMYGKDTDSPMYNMYKECCEPERNCLPEEAEESTEKITYGDLVRVGLVKDTMKNPNTSLRYSDNLKIKITYYKKLPSKLPANSKLFGNYLFEISEE